MRVLVYSARDHDEESLVRVNDERALDRRHDLRFTTAALDPATVALADGFDAVSAFVNDDLSCDVLDGLHALNVLGILMRCAGTNNVDLDHARRIGVAVANVPEYSPHAVAEHTVALMLSLNRQIHRAFVRVREGNFALNGLLGFDMRGKTVGVVGTGRIGTCVVRILRGFGCAVLMNETRPDPSLKEEGAEYVELDELLERSRIVTLHCPLTPRTRHMIDDEALARMKPGAMLVNTSRGGLVDTGAVIRALKSRHLGSLGIDVYEEEAGLFFRDASNDLIDDDVFARLLTFPNVLVTGHQAFFTHEAVDAIARTTLANADDLTP